MPMNRIDELQAVSSRIVLENSIEPTADLQRERQRASFSSQELSIIMNGGIERLEVSVLSLSSGASPSIHYHSLILIE